MTGLYKQAPICTQYAFYHKPTPLSAFSVKKMHRKSTAGAGEKTRKVLPPHKECLADGKETTRRKERGSYDTPLAPV